MGSNDSQKYLFGGDKMTEDQKEKLDQLAEIIKQKDLDLIKLIKRIKQSTQKPEKRAIQ